ncbi:MAG: porin family protein [Bacteroidia bacterium]
MKNLVAFLILAFIAFNSTAQEKSTPDFQKVNFGLRFNPLISFLKVDSDTLEGTGPKLGFSYGAMLEFNLAENYAVAFELMLSQVPGSFKYTTSGIDSSVEMNVQYVEIPVMLKGKTNEIGYFTYFGHFGLDIGMRTVAKGDVLVKNVLKYEDIVLNGEEIISDGERTGVMAPDVRFFRLGLVIGAGAQYSLGGSTYLLGGLSFNNGFTNVVKEHPIKSAYVALNLGVLF